MLKIILLFSVLAFLGRAHADPRMESHSLNHPKFGTLTLTLEPTGEPAVQPYAMSVRVLCKDNRREPNSIKPEEQDLIWERGDTPGVPICDFVGHQYDEKKAVLKLNYVTFDTDHPDKGCDAEYSQTFDLKKLCKRWNN